MKLHENKDDFAIFINEIADRTGIRGDILEKDYYVSLFLKEISEKQAEGVPMYFKGGTALYKIMDEPRRFSEDIDLTVDVRDLSNTQAKKTLEKASNKFTVLPRLKGDIAEENLKGSITAVYGYDSIFTIEEDRLQRFGKLKVEATSFTVSDPVAAYDISSLLYKYASDNEKAILDKINCSPIKIQTISLERMFADKLLAAEFYLERNALFDVSKHLYDINVLMSDQRIQELLEDEDLIISTLSYKRIEEQKRIGSDLAKKPLKDLKIFSAFSNDKLVKAFEEMQKTYVFDDKYRLPISEVQTSLKNLKPILYNISDKEQEYLNSEFFSLLADDYKNEKASVEKSVSEER